jgi:ABC transporter, ATP-binding protein
MESTDCGAVCLQMLCAFYGKPISLQYIKEGLSISRIGITIRDVKTRATELGLNTIVAKATLQQIVKMQSPVILHWNNNHFVVLYKVKKERGDTYSYYIADPANGKIKFTEKEIKRYWLEEKEDGIVILTQPTFFL